MQEVGEAVPSEGFERAEGATDAVEVNEVKAADTVARVNTAASLSED